MSPPCDLPLPLLLPFSSLSSPQLTSCHHHREGGGPPPTFSRENGECFGVCMPCVSPVLSLQSSPQCRFPLSRPPGLLLLIYDVYPPPPRSTIFFSLILPLSCTPPSSSLPLPFPPPLQTPGQYLRQTLSIAVAVVAGVVLTNSLLPLLPFPPPPPLLATPSHRTLPRTIRRRRFPSPPPRIEKLRNSHLFFLFFILPLPPVDFHFHRCWTARTGD